MLHECLTDAELDVALEATKNIPAFLNVHYPILFHKTNRFPEVDWRIFWFENEKHEKLFIVSRIYKFAPLRSFLIFCFDLENTKFDKSVLWNVFDEISRLLPILYDSPGPVAIAYGQITTSYEEWFNARFNSMKVEHYPCYYYYMTPEQQQLLIKDYMDGVPLPDCYYFDKADVERDAPIIFKTWRHSAPGDFETTKAKIRNLPTSLVREKETDEAVAFELVDSCGFLNHLFTVPEHRNKGLGTAVEIDLCFKLIKEGIVPFKDVELFNKAVLASSDRSKYWTRWEHYDEPVVLTFLKHVEKIEN